MSEDRRHFLTSSLPLAGAAVLGGAAAAAAVPGTGAVALPQEEVPAPIAALTGQRDQEPPAITDAERAARCERARTLMAGAGLDAILLLGGTGMRYFSDVDWGRSERVFALLIPQRGEIAWICPAFEQERAEEQIRAGELRTWEEDESPYTLIARLLADRGLATGRIGLEETVYYHVAAGLGRDAPALAVTSADPVTIGCRSVKSPAEIALLRFANQVTIRAYQAAWESLREGLTQAQFAAWIAEAFRRLGYSGGALVLFGANSAFPHGTRRSETLREGMVILYDGGTTVGGYHSDITRSGVLGEVGLEQRRVWAVVKEAQTAALRAAAPGVPAGEVDRAAREVIDRGGFGPGYRYFTHRLGHGIGLDGHEWHYLVRGNRVPLAAGMTFSDEPGIYIPGSFGIRLEDIMVVTDQGAELLTPQAGGPNYPFGI
jgi:Xaa-Pro dipeptidase